MRLSSWFAAIILAGGIAFGLQPVANSATAQGDLTQSDWQGEVASQDAGPTTPSLDALKAKLGPDDPIAALEAVAYALDEVADGATYVWQRADGPLQGTVKPVDSFLDDNGALCRRLSVTLMLGEASRWTEAVACRDEAGHWTING